ncbi:hypothetical protein FGO68_gene10242 [Halteria grandinella]|uniref:Peptidyl-prolyl cis-trans isomerase n=1 Tax=Halteria grandinella TaxID=5974 RepID=A0A8J8NLC3_HALGN|nr:hypothetical protein FGO68_gene10242 [Halteria grandinella]
MELWTKQFTNEDWDKYGPLLKTAQKQYVEFFNKPTLQLIKVHAQVFFDITIDGEDSGRIVFNLYANTYPTSENFRALCTGEKGNNKQNKPLHYKGTQFFKVIKGSYAQGGDITKDNGEGGESIYGPKFADENFINKHARRGLLAMANKGRHTNNSQFYITFSQLSKNDGKNVVFGEVADEDSFRVLDKIEKYGTESGKVDKKILITNSGEQKFLRIE